MYSAGDVIFNYLVNLLFSSDVASGIFVYF